MLIKSMTMLAVLAVSPSLHAEPADDNDFAADPAPNTNLDALKARCEDFARNPQIKPVKVQVSCSAVTFFWKAMPAKQATLPNTKTVGVSFTLKGAPIQHQDFLVKTDDTKLQCEEFIKTERRVANIDTELACDQIMQLKDLSSYCSPIIDQRAAQDPGLVKEQPTAEKLSLCPQLTGGGANPTPPAPH